MERSTAVAVVVVALGVAVVASCTGEQRRIARDVLDVIEVVCKPDDAKDSCLDKIAASRAREGGVPALMSAPAPLPPPTASGSFTAPPSPAPAASSK